jgi:hypothetical protein
MITNKRRVTVFVQIQEAPMPIADVRLTIPGKTGCGDEPHIQLVQVEYIAIPGVTGGPREATSLFQCPGDSDTAFRYIYRVRPPRGATIIRVVGEVIEGVRPLIESDAMPEVTFTME